MYEEQPFTFLSRKKRVKAWYITKVKSNEGDSEDSDNNISTEYETDDIQSGESSAQEDESSPDNDKFLNEFENYSYPIFDFDEQDTSELPKEDRFTWILIWIMKFRSNYNIPDNATEVLIKFVKLLLKECGNLDHKSFPNSYIWQENF